jgi:sortase A
MKNLKKITITLFLILLVLSPTFFFILYPNYNNLVLAFNSFDPYNISKEASVKILTQISPSREKYHEQVLGATSIEESLGTTEINLDRKILEELNTTISIDTINIEGKIVQGESSLRMDDGFWHFPTTSFPGEKGNSVIIGHRFLYLPPRKDTFFNLEDIKIGENIVISQSTDPSRPEEKEFFNYIVTETKIVESNDISVIQQTDDYRLTLITCTPLWTSEKRFVVIAKLDKLYKKV